MSSAAKIDFESYFALFVTSLERFSIPALGSFVWHIERVEIDPKAAQIKPPRPQLKYEPGQRYLTQTVAFLMDRYGFSEEEAEVFLKELGNILVNYLKAANEMDVWKLGKLRRAGVSYRLELHEEAPLGFLEDLQPVSLRHSEGAVAPLKGISQPAPSAPPKKEKKTKSATESTRAKSIEPTAETETPPARKGRGLAWIGITFLILVAIGIGAYLLMRQRAQASRQPVEVLLGSKQGTQPPRTEPSSSPTTPEPTKPANEPAPPSSKPEKTPEAKSTQPPSPPPVPKESPASPPPKPTPSQTPTPPPSLTKPQKGRYYIIVGSYPSLQEAQEKAKALASPTIEFLPGKEGRVRLSYYSSTNKGEVEARLKEVKSRIPDAWVFTP